MSVMQRKLLGLPSYGSAPDYEPPKGVEDAGENDRYYVAWKAAKKQMESEGAGQIDTPDGQTITLRTHGRQSIAGKLGVAFNTSAETMMRRPLNRVKESEETNANKPLLNNFKPKSHRERKETIRVFQNGAERHVRMTVAGKAGGIPKEKILALYPNVDIETFDNVYNLFDWNVRDSSTVVKTFSLLMASMMGGSGGTMEDDIDMAFDIFDVDGSGTLDRKEFKKMMGATFSTKMNSLKLMMQTEEGRKSLMEFAQSEFSDENIEFIQVAEKWREGERTKEETAALYNEYIKQGAPKQVNLSGKTRKNTNKKYEEEVAEGAAVNSLELLDPALADIYKLVEKDTFRRFQKKTEQMDSMFGKLYDEIDVSHDGHIQRDEYKRWTTQHPEALDFMRDLHTKLTNSNAKAIAEAGEDEAKT